MKISEIIAKLNIARSDGCSKEKSEEIKRIVDELLPYEELESENVSKFVDYILVRNKELEEKWGKAFFESLDLEKKLENLQNQFYLKLSNGRIIDICYLNEDGQEMLFTNASKHEIENPNSYFMKYIKLLGKEKELERLMEEMKKWN